MGRLRKSDLISQDLKSYLADRKPVRPFFYLVRDSSFLWALNGLLISSMAVMSGFHDSLGFGIHGQFNYFRILQGSLSWLNMAVALVFITIGRVQVYKDLSDFQKGVDPQTIIDRASRKSFFDNLLFQTHNNAAKIGIALSVLMLCSGIASLRWGEAMTAMFWIWAYLERLRNERYEVHAPEAKKSLFWYLNGKPLMKSALIQTARTLPALINAILVFDLYQTTQFTLLIIGLFYLSNSTKDGIGRYSGSLISAETKNGFAIAKVLLEGRYKGFSRK